MSELKALRKEKNLTQQQVAELAGISLRSYKSYENDEEKKGTIKYKYLLNELAKINPIDEEHGILELAYIKQKCESVFIKYSVDYCYLFGSYAKGTAGSTSDVDLLISADIKGIKFYGMVEKLRDALRKRVDFLDLNQLKDNVELTNEILKYGIKIYG